MDVDFQSVCSIDKPPFVTPPSPVDLFSAIFFCVLILRSGPLWTTFLGLTCHQALGWIQAMEGRAIDCRIRGKSGKGISSPPPFSILVVAGNRSHNSGSGCLFLLEIGSVEHLHCSHLAHTQKHSSFGQW